MELTVRSSKRKALSFIVSLIAETSLFLVALRGQVHFCVVSPLGQLADVNLFRIRVDIALHEFAFFAAFVESGGVVGSFDVADQAGTGIVSNERLLDAPLRGSVGRDISEFIVIVRIRVLGARKGCSGKKAHKKFHFLQDFLEENLKVILFAII